MPAHNTSNPQGDRCRCCGQAATSQRQVYCAKHRPVGQFAPPPVPTGRLTNPDYESALRDHLSEYAKGHRIIAQNVALAVQGVFWTISQAWSPFDIIPPMAVIFGSPFTATPSGAPCGHARPDLVRDGLADAGDLYIADVGDPQKGIGFAVLRDPAAPRSFLRILFPDGDRTVIILPPEYDGL